MVSERRSFPFFVPVQHTAPSSFAVWPGSHLRLSSGSNSSATACLIPRCTSLGPKHSHSHVVLISRLPPMRPTPLLPLQIAQSHRTLRYMFHKRIISNRTTLFITHLRKPLPRHKCLGAFHR
jgi:hypothetical protein